MVALDEVIAQINDLFSGDHPNSSVRNVVTHIKDRLEESETLQQQARNNTLPQFSAANRNQPPAGEEFEPDALTIRPQGVGAPRARTWNRA
jgi:hypothetical protein